MYFTQRDCHVSQPTYHSASLGPSSKGFLPLCISSFCQYVETLFSCWTVSLLEVSLCPQQQVEKVQSQRLPLCCPVEKCPLISPINNARATSVLMMCATYQFDQAIVGV